MGIVVLIVLMAAAMLLFPAAPLLLAKMGAGRNVLEESFARQQAPHGGGTIPTSQLTVLYRIPGMTSYSQNGGLMDIDASWLCRAPDGSYLLALGQGLRRRNELAVMPWNRKPLEIHWTWRVLSKEQAQRLMPRDAGILG